MKGLGLSSTDSHAPLRFHVSSSAPRRPLQVGGTTEPRGSDKFAGREELAQAVEHHVIHEPIVVCARIVGR